MLNSPRRKGSQPIRAAWIEITSEEGNNAAHNVAAHSGCVD